MAQLLGDFSKALAVASDGYNKLANSKSTKFPQNHTSSSSGFGLLTEMFREKVTNESNAHSTPSHEDTTSNVEIRSKLVDCIKSNNMREYKKLLKKLKDERLNFKGKPTIVFYDAANLEATGLLYESMVMYTLVSKTCLDLNEIDIHQVMILQKTIESVHHLSRLMNLVDVKKSMASLIYDCIEDIQKIKKIDQASRISLILFGYLCLGGIYNDLGSFQNNLTALSSGLAIMEKEFGDQKSRYKINVMLLSGMGACYMSQKMYEKAISFFEKAISAIEECKDWANPEEKQTILHKQKIALENCKVDMQVSGPDNAMIQILEYVAALDKDARNKEPTKYKATFKKASEFVKTLNDDLMGPKLLKVGQDLFLKAQIYSAFAGWQLVSKSLLNQELSEALLVVFGESVLQMALLLKILGESEDEKSLFGRDFVFPAINGVIHDLLSLSGFKEFRFQIVARCYFHMGSSYRVLFKDREALQLFNQGLKILRKELSKSALEKYRIHGILLHGIGSVYADLGQLNEAKQYLNEANAILRTSTDWDSDDEKANMIKINQVCMANFGLFGI